MNAPARNLSDTRYTSHPYHSRSDVRRSRPDVALQNFGADAGVHVLAQIDGDAFRAWFTPAFAAYLQRTFRNTEEVAAVFGVRHSTACNWWNGANRATGDAVTRLFMAFPDAVAWFLREWEGRQ